jgi:hypothetical protein
MPGDRTLGWESLLAALPVANESFAAKARQLESEPRWSHVAVSEFSETTWGTELSKFSDTTSGTSDGEAHGFMGSLSGEHVNGPVGWAIDLIPDGEGWSVERHLWLEVSSVPTDDIEVSLPEVTCGNSLELASMLPELVRELLEHPPPAVSP